MNVLLYKQWHYTDELNSPETIAECIVKCQVRSSLSKNLHRFTVS